MHLACGEMLFRGDEINLNTQHWLIIVIIYGSDCKWAPLSRTQTADMRHVNIMSAPPALMDCQMVSRSLFCAE